MKIMIEEEPMTVSRRILSDRGMMSVDRSLMERLQELHPEMMVYNPVEDSYHPVSVLERLKVR